MPKNNKEEEIKEKRLEDLKRLKALFRKYKATTKAKYDVAPFNEPVLMLSRKNGEIEFYDKATAGIYTFEHTDGERRHITLKGFPKTMRFYGTTIKTWLCDEDHPFPLPSRPLVDSELFTMSKDKDLNDTQNYKAKEIKARAEGIKQILIGVGILIGILVLAKMLLPDLLARNPEETVEVAKVVAQNTSSLINSATII